MLELIPLYSGSSGNATLVKKDGHNILFDIGKNCKQTCLALEKVGVKPEEIEAIYITHSHVDHVQGADVFIRKYNIPLYATEQTIYAMRYYFKKPHTSPEIFIQDFDVTTPCEGLKVFSCPTSHDASGSVCYRVEADGKSLMIMTDLGFVSDDIRTMATGVDGILIESNYDIDMLVYGDYPPDLKSRIAGQRGHLSNIDCAHMMKYLIENGTKNFILGHLSENNNTPQKAYETNVNFLMCNRLECGVDYHVRTANRHEPTEGITV